MTANDESLWKRFTEWAEDLFQHWQRGSIAGSLGTLVAHDVALGAFARRLYVQRQRARARRLRRAKWSRLRACSPQQLLRALR